MMEEINMKATNKEIRFTDTYIYDQMDRVALKRGVGQPSKAARLLLAQVIPFLDHDCNLRIHTKHDAPASTGGGDRRPADGD
jgi:hypothetical protein